jgi:Holliday junction resolvase RusA-like endonuclease
MPPTRIEFFVPGSPVPAGSKRAFPFQGQDGGLHVAVSDDSGARGKDWRAAIRYAALAQEGPKLCGPLHLSLCFYVPRPKSHSGKRGLLPSAPRFPTTKPDVLKLARAVEDACTGILWLDDAQIVDEELHKLYADGRIMIGVRVVVTPLAPRSSELAAGALPDVTA